MINMVARLGTVLEGRFVNAYVFYLSCGCWLFASHRLCNVYSGHD